MSNEINIQSCVIVPEETTNDEFIEKYIKFIKENGWNLSPNAKTEIYRRLTKEEN